MAGMDFNHQTRQGADALHAEEAPDQHPACGAGDLKGLLNAIVDQISEADRRHTDTLQQLQERMTSIGREAKAIKPRVPDAFAAAFERLEAGMAELAVRVAEAGEGKQNSVEQHTASYTSQPAAYEPPAALRSAFNNVVAATRRREEETSRVRAGVDTFDVIESSLPGNVSDPWDRDSAEALAGLYESDAAGFSSKSLPSEIPVAETRNVVANNGHSFHAAVPGVDHIWLEARFSEISKRIEESLAEIRPDQGFFAVGQRVDQLEQHFSNLIEGVATRGDVEGVRLIEAHVSELAGHLENTHHQLLRLDMIEGHLAGIASKLDDVHHAAMLATGDAEAPAFSNDIDIHSVARSAAEAAAQHFAALQSKSQPAHDNTEIRDMLRGLISETRQGDENTNALLDTLQQAMIRLLDRVDAIEMNAINSAQSHSQAQEHVAPQEYGREAGSFGIDLRGMHDHAPSSPALDAAVAAVASAKSLESPFTQAPADLDEPRYSAQAEPAMQRSPEKIRQDFIAEARRAKMRLSADAAGDAAEAPLYQADITASELEIAQVTQPARASIAASRTKAASNESESSPRLRVLALAGALALGGGWYAMQSGHLANLLMVSLPFANGQSASGLDAGKPAAKEAHSDAAPILGLESAPDAAAQAKKSADESAAQPDLQNGTHGEIVTDPLTVGSTSVPLSGVAVDSEKQMSAAELKRVRRQQAMAAVSGQLGQAATQNAAAVAIPASLQPNGNSATPNDGLASVANGTMTQSAPLDLPPATVGPLSLRLAAANGDPSAEFEVGARLAEGKGTDQSFKDAAKWYQRSASKGFAQAQYRLGTLYERGLGLKADPARAQDWYKRAAEQGNIKAMHNLAVLSANQSGGSPDYATAAMWFEKAADLGLSDSQFNLAVLHENGLGVEQDLIASYKWLVLAARGGDKEAIRRRDILKGKLTAEQLAKADELVAAWKPKMADQQANDARKAGEAWKKNPANGVNG